MVPDESSQMKSLWIWVTILVLALISPTAADELPAGFQHIPGSSFDWAIAPGTGQPPDALSRLVESHLHQLRQWLGSRSQRKPLVLLVVSNAALNRTLTHYGSDPVPGWVPAVALTRKGTVIIDVQYMAANPIAGSATVVHELAHLVLEEAAGALPRWVHEGIAQSAAHQLPDPSTRRNLILQARGAALVPITDLDQYLPKTHVRASLLYAEACSFIEWTRRNFDHQLHKRILARCRDGTPWQQGFEQETGLNIDDATRMWSEELARSDVYLGLIVDLILSWKGLAILVIIAAAVQSVRRRKRLRQMEEEEWQSQRFPTSDGQNQKDNSDDIS